MKMILFPHKIILTQVGVVMGKMERMRESQNEIHVLVLKKSSKRVISVKLMI